jgi:hypothetical protein
MATTSYSNWKFHNYNVQQDLKGGQFVSAESTLVAAGPPRLSQASGQDEANQTAPTATAFGDKVYPIGLLESFALQQNKQLQRIFEIGSIRSYFVPGRTVGSVSLGRTFYFGPSLLRVLYAYYRSNGDIKVGTKNPESLVTDSNGNSILDPQAALLGGANPAALHKLRRSPGEDYFFIDLASDLFAQPTGMCVYFKDCNGDSLAAMYLEDTYVQGHQMTVSSGSVLIMEGASLQYDQIRPIKMMATTGA